MAFHRHQFGTAFDLTQWTIVVHNRTIQVHSAESMRNLATAHDPSTRVRLPVELMKAVDKKAKKNGRSRNSEIVVLIRQGLSEREMAKAE